MRRILIGVAVIGALAVVGVLAWGSVSSPVEAGKPADAGKKEKVCVRIKDGVLEYSAGHYFAGMPLTVGEDDFGYNYQAHMFKGSYANVYLGRAGYPPYEGNDVGYLAENPDAASHWAWPYRDIQLLMKWNDAWLANTDCDDDGLLDRHFGYDSYIGSGAWETNHMWGDYEDEGLCNWNYFTKIVAAPSEAIMDSGFWYTTEGVEIGPVLWGDFATIMEVSNDPCAGDHGMLYNAPAPTGFGYYGPSGYEIVDSLEVSASDSDGEETGVVLEDGIVYILKVYGTADAGAGIEFDAMYSISNTVIGDSWTDLVTGYESYGTELLDLQLDGSSPDWGDYNDYHVYMTEVVGDGTTLNLMVNDVYYPNNSGSIMVDVLREL